MKAVYLSSILVLSAVLAGCGGSSNNDDATTDSYIQFYNGSAIAGSTQLKAGETNVGSTAYGDVSSVVGIESGEYELAFTDSATSTELLKKTVSLAKDNKALFILTNEGEQYNHLNVSFKYDEQLDKKFNLHLVNLSSQQPELDVYIAAEGKPFTDAELLDSLSRNEVTSAAKTRDIGKYNLYLTKPGQTTPIFTTQAVNFAYENTYVVLIRDKNGPLAGQLSLDVVLNSSSVQANNNINAKAQFRLYNSLQQNVELALDSNVVASVAAGQMSPYIASEKGDYSLSVRNDSADLLLNSALLSINAGDSKMVLLYQNANAVVEALTSQEKDTPQLQAHDVMVANLVPDLPKLQFYFVRQNETINTARYNIKNAEFKKQQSINLPKDYYAIALVHIAENGSTTLLDKTESMMLEPGKHYSLLAEKNNAAPSGYQLKLVH
ncbi:DUF4397 domain-containing protein [Rheinheimera metallidurans]|uniref:DUF4397 domain-containing protein n=1 Tax=Rheinheimera metallidurans TaxID=2925781 RepID=UPI003003290B